MTYLVINTLIQICVYSGSSGSGKSFFAKLMIFKHYMSSKTQYIFDPEGEYVNFIKKIKGEVFSLDPKDNRCINIMQIFEIDAKINGKNVVKNKVNEILELLKEVCNIPKEYCNNLRNAILNAYKDKGIIDEQSIYKNSNKDNVYIDNVIKDAEDFPTIIDILNYEIPNNIKSQLANIFSTRMKCLARITNIDLTNKLILFNTMKQDNIIIKYILEKISVYLKHSLDKTIIYVDEIWRYINNKTDKNISEVIFMLFKTIRKNNASIVTITQDINDFFAYDNGNYGKSILNNCCFKMFFKVDYLSSEILQKIGVMEGVEKQELLHLDKGEALINFKNNVTTLSIKATKYEMNLIEGDNY